MRENILRQLTEYIQYINALFIIDITACENNPTLADPWVKPDGMQLI